MGLTRKKIYVTCSLVYLYHLNSELLVCFSRTLRWSYVSHVLYAQQRFRVRCWPGSQQLSYGFSLSLSLSLSLALSATCGTLTPRTCSGLSSLTCAHCLARLNPTTSVSPKKSSDVWVPECRRRPWRRLLSLGALAKCQLLAIERC